MNNNTKVNTPTESMMRTALHLAVLNNNQVLIRLLLSFGANPNAVDIDFCTPVHYASEFGHLEIV